MSVSREESVEGIIGLGAPVWAPDGQLAAAVHVSALKARLRGDRVGLLGSQMRTAAARIACGLDVVAPTEAAA